MNDRAKAFLQDLLLAPSPSGYERPAQDVVRRYVADFADEVTTDLHGNVIVAKNPKSKLRVMYAGHCDQIGFLIQHIDEEGYLYLQPIGGWDMQVLVGQRLVAWGANGAAPGVMARKAVHLLTEEERKQIPKFKELWLDIGAKNKAEAESLVAIGDPVTLELGYRELRNGLAYAPGMDDKCGLWVVIEALRRAVESGGLSVGLFAVSTVQEEVGLRGAKTSAFSIDPQVGIAVDVTHATDCPGMEKKQEGDVKVGAGPVVFRGPNMNPVVVDKLREAAKSKDISVQWAAASRPTGTDANMMQVNRGGMATGLVSIPNRYMHSPVEVISLQDIDRAADLLATFALQLSENADFRP